MPVEVDGTFAVSVRWLVIAICMGRSSRLLREARPDGTSGREFSERQYRRILVVEVLASNLDEEVPVTGIVVVMEQEARRRSVGVAVVVVGGTGLVVKALAGQRRRAGPRGNRGRPGGFGVKLLNRRMHLAEVVEGADAYRTWRRTLFVCDLPAASCAEVVL
jgi:hypothetical protein